MLAVCGALMLFGAAAGESRVESRESRGSGLATRHWSFQPIKRLAVPDLTFGQSSPPQPPRFYARSNRASLAPKNRRGGSQTRAIENPIDAFLLAKLWAKGLKPAPPADRRTLIRRATFDLIGLPPTPEEVEAFVQDRSPDAWEKVIDRLLASPHYGERWGRHWLDVVRYADSNGLDENVAFANAWRYRDYVVNAFNQDKPYNQFILEQLAGDLLPSDDPSIRNERLTATGFLSLGAKLLAESDKPKMVMDIVDEQIDVTGKAFLGLTVSCARCHNHKFDPIPTQDYYALAGIFKSTKTMSNLATVAMWQERPLMTPALEAQKQAHEPTIKAAQVALKAAMDKGDKEAVKQANDALKKAQEAAPKIPMAMAVEEGKAENCRVHLRGNTQTLGEEVPRRFLTVLAGDRQTPIDDRRSGRLELAQWIADARNPLTARVLVNRVWQDHFGEGLVRTPDNFGRLGEKPSHPELLDWLASTFIAEGEKGRRGEGEKKSLSPSSLLPPPWSLKRLHRLIMTSAAYRMSSADDAKAAQLDPDNRLLWRFPRRRLEAEPFRDAMLVVSGRLDRTLGGSLLTTGNHDYVTNDQSGNAAQYGVNRRSLYLPVIRNALYDFFQAFDMGDPSMVNAKRASTTVAPQALYVMNSSFAIEQAHAFAADLLARAGWSDAERIRRATLRAFARPPSPAEVSRALTYQSAYAARLAPMEPDARKRRERAWASWCQILFASNEFIYVN